MRWAMLGLLFVARLGMGFQFQTLGSVGEGLTAQTGLSNTELGTLIGLFMLPGVFLAMPGGWLARFASDRAIVAFGMLLLALGGAIVGLTADFALMGLGRVICGAGFVLTYMYFSKMTVDWFAGRELATAMSILIVSWPGGIALSQMLHPYLAQFHGWQAAPLSAGGFCLAVALLVLLLYRAPPVQAVSEGPRRPESRLTRPEWFLTSTAAMSWGFWNAGYLVFLSFSIPALTGTGLPVVQAALIASMVNWLAMLSIPGAGFVADRFKCPTIVVMTGMTVATAAVLLLPVEGLGLWLCLGFGLVGIAPAGIVIALAGTAMAPERRAFGMGVHQTWYFVLTAPAPVLGGLAYDQTGSLYGPLGLAAGLFVLTAVLYIVYIVARRRLNPPPVQA